MKQSARARARAALALASTAVTLCAASLATAQVSLDQEPIVRVVRLSDVPASHDLYLPSGALEAEQLAANDTLGTGTQRREVVLLHGDGFVSAAISGYEGPGRRRMVSVAIELASPGDAARALHDETKLSIQARGPAGTQASSERDGALAHAMLVRFRPARAGAVGGLELIAMSGSWLYMLQAIDQPDTVSRHLLEHLVKLVSSRH